MVESILVMLSPQSLQIWRGLCILQAVSNVSREVYKFGFRNRARGYGEEWLTSL